MNEERNKEEAAAEAADAVAGDVKPEAKSDQQASAANGEAASTAATTEENASEPTAAEDAVAAVDALFGNPDDAAPVLDDEDVAKDAASASKEQTDENDPERAALVARQEQAVKQAQEARARQAQLQAKEKAQQAQAAHKAQAASANGQDAAGAVAPVAVAGTAAAVGQGASQVSAAAQPGWTNGQESSAFSPSVPNHEDKKRRRGLKIALTALLVALVAVYVAGGLYFSGTFFPNTKMGAEDISLKPAKEVAAFANAVGSDYRVAVVGDGVDFTIAAQDAGISIDGDAVVNNALSKQQPWSWPLSFFTSQDFSDELDEGFNAGGVEEIVRKEIDTFNQTATDPVNATLEFDSATKQFKVKPEAVGTKLDPEAVIDAVDEAVTTMSASARLDQSHLVQPTVLSDDPALDTACDKANSYIKADIKLTIGPDATQVADINGDTISQWVRVDDSLNVTFDHDAMLKSVREQVNSLDTVGTERKYTRPDGKEITVEGGTYGWETDSDALVDQLQPLIEQGKTQTLEIPTVTQAAKWTEKGQADWGSYVDVDLSEQYARYYDEAGNIMWEAPFISGKPDGEHDTSTGVYAVFIKESPSVLKGNILPATGQPEYETPVDFWMQWTYMGIGFHDATWQPGFGGSMYADGYGSHGCINLSYSNAAALFNILPVGETVVSHW